ETQGKLYTTFQCTRKHFYYLVPYFEIINNAIKMIRITNSDLEQLSIIAKQSERKRMNKNYHPKLNDTLQRLLNAMEPGTYVQPHKHEEPDKREIFIILKGSALVVEFDNDGEITEHMLLSAEVGNFVVEIQPCVYHTVISLEPGTVVYEVKDGPYNPLDDKNFAKWAPKEGDSDCQRYNSSIIQKTLNQLSAN
ncbi:MAG: WbuC family cupin fold metalloprotein, partial [Clostridia bacterium]|nr:WbuC family cupin fold metalloprotein [Clostridia bacterium]